MEQQLHKACDLMRNITLSNRSERGPHLQNSIDTIEKTLVPIIHKLHCSNQGDASTQSLPAKEDVVNISKNLAELYIQNASNNSKVAHRLKKIIDKLERILPESIQHVEEAIWKLITPEDNTCGLDLITLKTVSNLLEDSVTARKALEAHFTPFTSTLAITLTEGVRSIDVTDDNYTPSSSSSAMQVCQLGAKICLQMCRCMGDKLKDILWIEKTPSSQCCPDGDSCPPDVANVTQNFHCILQALLDMISNKVSKECSLMAGGALAMVLNSATKKKEADSIALNMLQLHSKCEVWTPEMAINTPDNSTLSIGNISIKCKCPTGDAPTRKFSQLTLLRGLLTCSKNESILQDKALLLDVIFPMVCGMCYQLRDMQYHALQVLTYWLQTVKRELAFLHQSQDVSDASVDTKEEQRIFSPQSKVVQDILAIAWQSWQSPVDGVPELVKSIVALLLEAYEAENKLLEICESKLYKMITTRLQHSPWHVKGRYQLLCTVIPYCNSTELLASYPALPSHLLECLGTNYLAVAATDVYRVWLQCLKANSKTIKRRKSDEDVIANRKTTEWERYWQQTLLTGLCSDDEVVRYHIINYWLPLTVKFLPESYGIMRTSMQSVCEGISNTRVLHAQIILLQQARMNQVNEQDWMVHEWEGISAALWHCDEDVRSDAFSLVCITPKKSQMPSEMEVQLIQNFIPNNMNCDSASFRNKLHKSIRAVLTRMRDGSLACLRQLKKEEAKANAKDELRIGSLSEQLNMGVRFFKMFLDTAISSLFPGACYQRKKMSLDVVSLLYETLLHGSGSQKVQGGNAGSSETLLEWARTHHQFDLLSERTAVLILTCVQDGSNDIRNVAFNLLITFYPPILPSSISFPATCGNEILCSGLRLICHPKAHMADAGALLCKLTFMKSILQVSTNQPGVDETSNLGNHDNQPPTGIDVFIIKLLDILKYQFKCTQANFVSAAALTPMHGVILTIRRCLTEDPSILQLVSRKHPDKWSTIMEDILNTIHDIVFFILGVLSGRKTEEEEAAARNLAPSFGQMGEAIDGLIGALSHVQLDGVEKKEDTTAVSDEHQVVLSCCWLNLKESSVLLGALAESCPLCDEENKGGLLQLSHLQRIADIMIEILTKCRHKGAIEGCNQGFARLCARLLSSHNQKFASLPHSLLERVLGILTTAESSFTKKSAGLPLVVESIIVAEPKGREKYLLQHAMQRLASIAKQPLPDNPDGNMDLPQTHAINVMMALFRCSAINTDMLTYVGDAVEFAITGFACPFWAIRNCCMQLFGTLVARIFGQKRVADEHSNLNSLSASEFVFRYPSLKEYLLTEMKQAMKVPEVMDQDGDDLVTNNREILLFPTMHPVLSVLAKLGLGVEQHTEKRTLEEFLDPITHLLSSPIYSIRELASRAILPLVPEGKSIERAVEVVLKLPQKPEDSSLTNQLHGYLLLVHTLVQTAINGKSMCVEKSKALLDAFSKVSWLASASNSCAIVRALFIKTCNKIIQWMLVARCEDACNLVLWLREEAQKYADNPPEYQIGIPALNQAMTRALLLLSPSPSDQVSSIMSLLTSSHQDTRLAALEYPPTHPMNQELINLLYLKHWDLLTHSVLKENDIQCIHAGLSLYLYVTLNSSSATSIVQYDNVAEVWRYLSAMADGKRGSTLCAAALPVLSIIVRDHLMEGHIENGMLSEWGDWMLQYSDPIEMETTRLSVAKSLQICGVTALSVSCDSHIEDNIPAALCVFSAGLH
ncbi:tRNA (32-2'-O)-methyltransferase regulator THADA-like [Amphiura filiformis]|uniref:tRNA (32-2'-O)-methyltransferase regulator THADA-like n=1 Tax=Amphiura filiformis TaxID=82378 RepID=UPI003B21ECCF